MIARFQSLVLRPPLIRQPITSTIRPASSLLRPSASIISPLTTVAPVPLIGVRSLSSVLGGTSPLTALRTNSDTTVPGVGQTRGFASKKHKRMRKWAKGFRGRGKNCYRIAINRVEKSWQYAYRDRKNKKREFRRLWITRINAGVREHGVRYSQFVNKLHSSGILLNRKILSDLAMNEPFAFKSVVDVVKLRAAEQYATDEFFNLVEEGEDEGTLIEEKK